MQHSTRPPTQAEQARLDALAKMRCICCQIEGVEQPSRTTIHHIVDRGYRKHSGGHMATIPLCKWHHQGEIPYPLTSSEAVRLYGPSLARSKRNFVWTYGRERELLAEIDARLAKRVAA